MSEAGDEEIAAELAGELYDFLVEEGYHGHYPSAEEQADKFVAKAMFSLAPLIAEREAKAWDDCAREAHDLGWTHDYGRNDLMGRNPYRSNQ